MKTKDYLVILTRKNIDRFEHNLFFAKELSAAFAERKWNVKIFDYIDDCAALFDAIRDPHCKFFISFNGFGTELEWPSIYPGRLNNVFEITGKPILDLMHDCPIHETMLNQLHATYNCRKIFSTDYRYAAMALEMGAKNVKFIPSITFPHTLKQLSVPKNKTIKVLFAAGFCSPAYCRERIETSTRKGRLYLSIFDEVISHCHVVWDADPIVELKAALLEVGVKFDFKKADHRFLLSIIVDFVKFDRRYKMFETIKDLPITVLADRDVENFSNNSNITLLKPRSATELLALMGQSEIVLCPSAHISGFHERPLCALTAGAAVVSAPCEPLETNFFHGEDAMFFANPTQLRSSLETLLSDSTLLSSIANAGQSKAMSLFSPDRLVCSMLNSIRS